MLPDTLICYQALWQDLTPITNTNLGMSLNKQECLRKGQIIQYKIGILVFFKRFEIKDTDI